MAVQLELDLEPKEDDPYANIEDKDWLWVLFQETVKADCNLYSCSITPSSLFPT